MKKYLLLLLLPSVISKLSSSQNVGIGTTNPSVALHIKRDGEALRLQGSVPYLTFYNNSGTLKGFLQNSGDNLYLGTGSENSNGQLQFYMNGVPKMTLTSLGRVGINTNEPRAPLDVVNEVSVKAISSNYSYLEFSSFNNGILFSNSNPVPSVSIMASGNVYALEFDAFSDARIKNIMGLSNNSNDLQTINALQIVDYTLIDKVKNGNKPFKKVIAQQVEKVYPQVVSKHTDFIPNVYQLTSKIEKTANTYLFTFAAKHNISKTAKKIRVLLSEGQSMQQFDIVSIPADNKVEIRATDIKAEKAFVYGEEVDDFRTVDYEGLTTLNISATQELSKLVKKQQAAIDAQNSKIAELTEATKILQKERHASFALK